MKRRHVVALVIAAAFAVSATSIAATSGVLPLTSASRSTVTPPPKTKKPQRPAAAKVQALQKALAAARAKLKALQKSLAKAKTQAQKRALRKAIAAQQARVKALEKALAKAKQVHCATGFKLVKGKCVHA